MKKYAKLRKRQFSIKTIKQYIKGEAYCCGVSDDINIKIARKTSRCTILREKYLPELIINVTVENYNDFSAY